MRRQTERAALSRILHRDRINLDRARDREKFAAAAGTDARRPRSRSATASSTSWPRPRRWRGRTERQIDAAVREEALALLDAPDLLDRLGEAIRALGYAGDLAQPVLIFLVFVSRLLARPMNLVVGGPSAAGKSFVVALVARFFPPIATYALNGMSERLLAYTDADLRHRTLIIGEAAALHRDGIGASLLRSLAWEGHIVYETVESTPEGLKPRRIEKPGPTGFVTTTTKSVEAELETRVLTIHVPDDKQGDAGDHQSHCRTRQRPATGGAGLCGPGTRRSAGWPRTGTHEVTIPFAEQLAARYPADQVRSRRDFTQLLTLIQASAVLHQRQRERDELRPHHRHEDDYRTVYDLPRRSSVPSPPRGSPRPYGRPSLRSGT